MRRSSITCSHVLLLAVLLLAASALPAQGTPLYHNFVVLPEVTATSGQAFAMPVSLHNEEPLQRVTVPLQIRLVDFIDIDSISFVGGRFEGYGSASALVDNGNHALLIDFIASAKELESSGFLPAGDGDIATLYLRVAPDVASTDVVVDTTVFFGGGFYVLEDTTGVNVQDYFSSGLIHVISAQPIIHLQPTVFNFSTDVGVNPDPDTLLITNLGAEPLNWQITHQPAWLTLSATSGTAPSTLVLSPEVASYPVGTLIDSIAVNDDNALVPTEWAYVAVTISENPVVTRCLTLHEGWNLISWNVDTPDDDIETIIENIKGCIDVVLGFELGGATYDPSLSRFSTLTALDHLHGYWFRMDCDTTLCVTGTKVSPDTPIDLEPNWNLVSYLPEDADTTPHALSSVDR